MNHSVRNCHYTIDGAFIGILVCVSYRLLVACTLLYKLTKTHSAANVSFRCHACNLFNHITDMYKIHCLLNSLILRISTLVLIQ